MVSANYIAIYTPVITLKIGPDITKNKPVMPKSTTSLRVVMRCLLSNASRIFYSKYSLSYSFTSFLASYTYSYTSLRYIGLGLYSRAYAGVYYTSMYNVL